MSRKSSKATERGRGERNYKLYALNFHGSSLDAIRNEFIRVVKSGLRRAVFIIDLEEEERQLLTQAAYEEARPSKAGGKDAKKKTRASQQRGDTTRPKDLTTIAQMAIERCRKRYDSITQSIDSERRFDLLSYWIADIQSAPAKPLVPPPTAAVKAKEKPDVKTAKGAGGNKTAPRVVTVWTGPCPELKYMEHNKIGAPEKFARIKFIVDEPPNTKLFILLTGNLSEQLYRDLISRGEPLQMIIDFLPEKCAYDYLLPHPETDAFLDRIIQERQEWILSRRKLALFKGTGILQQSLPTISKCLARKLSKEVYAEMCWCIYDAEMLFQQYQLYYLKPFHLYNVAMEASVQIGHLFEVAESLSMQGHYLNAPVPAVDTDSTTVLLYLTGLLNTIGAPNRLLSPLQTLLLSRPSSVTSLHLRAMHYDKLVEDNHNAFCSITKVSKYDRLFTEDNNRALCSLVAFTKHDVFYNIYLSCLEYNLLRTYIVSSFIHGAAPYRKYTDNDGSEPIYLPPYVKLYSTEDGVKQRLVQLLDEYAEHQVDEFYPGHKLYTFRRTYNEVFEDARLIVLPSRLCFRDFTLFQKDEFLEDLVTPDERRRRSQARYSAIGGIEGFTKRTGFELDPSIFIRPNSLAARRLQSLMDLKMNAPNVRASKSEKRRTLLFDHKSELKRQGSWGDYTGLPAGHRLIEGYNLEDIRQEIHVKTSKYYFEEGMLQLYEERWCFDDTNKYLEMLVNGNKLTFCAPRHTQRGMLQNIRMITKNDVSVRMYGVQEECARVVINYPNGLVVYYNELFAEQVWCNESGPPTDELRRIYSPLGAVIVYYKDDEMILVMRYNGEVYRLYQHEPPRPEEEELIESNLDVPRDSKVTFKDLNIPPSDPISHKSRTSKTEESATTTTKKRKSSVRIKSSATDASRSQDGREKTSSFLNMPSRGSKNYLAESVENELKFLLKVCGEYALHYINLIMTTSTGRNVHISHRGNIFEMDIVENIEWHDYYANECYMMRGDGVKLLWTKDSLKCYHSDGTVIITKTEEGIDSGEFVDEYDSLITESTSHNPISGEDNIEPDSSMISIFVNQVIEPKLNLDAKSKEKEKEKEKEKQKELEKVKPSKSTTKSLYKEFLISEDEGEAKEEEDLSYVTYCCDNFHMLHRQYAAVQLFLMKNYNNEIKLMIEITAADGICVQVIKDETYEEELLNAMEMQKETYANISDRLTENLDKQRKSSQNVLKPNTAASRTGVGQAHKNAGGAGGDADTMDPLDANMQRPAKYIVKLWIGTELEMRVSEATCEIGAILQRYDDDQVKVPDKLDLKLDFNASINTTFQEFVSSISLFKNYTVRLSGEQYFIERLLPNCSLQGFEFFEKLPPMAFYNFAASNSVTEFLELPNIDEKFANVYAWHEVDMWKFPRFRDRRKRPRPPVDTFPMVLSAKVYCKIPGLLRNTEEIQKFIDPFETYDFKKNRRQIKETMDFYVRPQIQIMLKRRVSTMSWRRRLREHKRRLAIEQQRKTLYFAMLKHKVYPQYFTFISDFHGHVKYIDFFDFMRYKCEERPTVLAEVEAIAANASKTKPTNEPTSIEPNKFFKAKRRCPRYTND